MSLTDFSDTVAAPPSGVLAGLLAAGEAVASGGEVCGAGLPDPLDPQAASINPAITAPAALATRVRTFPPSIGGPNPRTLCFQSIGQPGGTSSVVKRLPARAQFTGFRADHAETGLS
jgi:hypothetical protein